MTEVREVLGNQATSGYFINNHLGQARIVKWSTSDYDRHDPSRRFGSLAVAERALVTTIASTRRLSMWSRMFEKRSWLSSVSAIMGIIPAVSTAAVKPWITGVINVLPRSATITPTAAVRPLLRPRATISGRYPSLWATASMWRRVASLTRA